MTQLPRVLPGSRVPVCYSVRCASCFIFTFSIHYILTAKSLLQEYASLFNTVYLYSKNVERYKWTLGLHFGSSLANIKTQLPNKDQAEIKKLLGQHRNRWMKSNQLWWIHKDRLDDWIVLLALSLLDLWSYIMKRICVTISVLQILMVTLLSKT